MEERLVWWNGEFVKESEAKISIYDSALIGVWFARKT